MASRHSVHFSNNSNEWGTPDDLFEELKSEFHFNLDPCSNGTNAKCEKYFTANEDGLSRCWGGV